MAELVEAAGEHRDHEDEQQQVRPLEGVVRRRASPRSKNTHATTATKPRKTTAAIDRPEEHAERVSQPMGGPRVRDGTLRLEPQQRVRASSSGSEPSASLSRPSGRRWLSTSVRTSASLMPRRRAWPTTRRSRRPRRPSVALSTR